MTTQCRLLFNEEPIIINRLAAKVLGLNEAIVVQQIHYWLNINEKAKKNFINGKYWTFNTYEKWQNENFDFWSISTIKRIFKNLFNKGILFKGKFNKKKYDQTLWVSINYDRLEELLNAYENDTNPSESTKIEINLDDIPEGVDTTDFIEKLYEKIVTDNPQLKGNVEISTECQNDTMSDCNRVSNWNSYECQNDTLNEVNMTLPIPKTTRDFSETSFCTTEQDKSSSVVEEKQNEFSLQVKDTNKEIIESRTHLVLDSNNKKYKVKKWKTDRLEKAIEIFIAKEGTYFSLLEKIYKDDRNFVPKKEDESNGLSSRRKKAYFDNATCMVNVDGKLKNALDLTEEEMNAKIAAKWGTPGNQLPPIVDEVEEVDVNKEVGEDVSEEKGIFIPSFEPSFKK